MPTATPAPTPPLVLLSDATGTLIAVTPDGSARWSLTLKRIDAILPAAGQGDFSVRSAGPNFLIASWDSTTKTGHVVLIDRDAHILADAAFPSEELTDNLAGSPTGNEWAYSIDDSQLSDDGPHHGRIVVDGINEQPHLVYSWTSPAPQCGICVSTDTVSAWTDMDIVVTEAGEPGCGIGFHPDGASFLVDPATGSRTPLFTGDHYADARHGVRVAYSDRSASTVIVNSTAYDVPRTIVEHAVVSPDGAYVGVERNSVGGCGDSAAFSIDTEIIDVASGATSSLAGCGIDAWLDASHIVCWDYSSNVTRVEGLDGAPGAIFGKATVLAVLPEV